VPGGKRPCDTSGVVSHDGLLGGAAPDGRESGRECGRDGGRAGVSTVGAIVGEKVAASGVVSGAARVRSFDASTAVPHAGQKRASTSIACPQEEQVTGEILTDSRDGLWPDAILARRLPRGRVASDWPTAALMAQASAESPKRAWLKAAEVCEVAQVQPYVLRTWEMEFADLGVTKTPGGPRVYRKADLDRVLRIKQLVFGEGLTLAGARRKIDEERGATAGDALPFDDDEALPPIASMPADARKRIFKVRDELRALLAMLSRPRGNGHALAAAAAHDESHDEQAQKKTQAAKAGKLTGHRKTATSRAKK
jgi:DNA-binding transcriptional MerR regulator